MNYKKKFIIIRAYLKFQQKIFHIWQRIFLHKQCIVRDNYVTRFNLTTAKIFYKFQKFDIYFLFALFNNIKCYIDLLLRHKIVLSKNMRFNYDLLITKAVVIVAEQNYESEHILAENYKLKKIYIKNTKVIPNGFCFNDISLEKVIIGKNTEEIRSYAFENCLSLKKIYIPKTI